MNVTLIYDTGADRLELWYNSTMIWAVEGPTIEAFERGLKLAEQMTRGIAEGWFSMAQTPIQEA